MLVVLNHGSSPRTVTVQAVGLLPLVLPAGSAATCVW